MKLPSSLFSTGVRQSRFKYFLSVESYLCTDYLVNDLSNFIITLILIDIFSILILSLLSVELTIDGDIIASFSPGLACEISHDIAFPVLW